ncbi:hypothetical protein THASP1DRAFT_27259 [Thamnocephalis sphaerospora]|uniref:HAUS augmin-like complex subunit 3 N-terminal domain-containing protein n=1 Tax=Thamnocephalis sphaerospora TaxID=78915 RepID=A0A4P9XZP1_9FUNG|nr:hypothetical protein THASP1DRAFT_27259 [Thamnocephalis sphaerospora]|eukprot:RKP10950.1 hypothetical protein THASP1DRAFT_27259 [Thamnocephalis sphaerospora]
MASSNARNIENGRSSRNERQGLGPAASAATGATVPSSALTAAQQFVALLRATGYTAANTLQAGDIEWAFTGDGAASNAMNWLANQVDVEENTLSAAEIACYEQLRVDGLVDERDLSSIERAGIFIPTLQEQTMSTYSEQSTNLQVSLGRLRRREHQLEAQYAAFRQTLAELGEREASLRELSEQLEQEAERGEDLALENTSLKMDRTVERAVMLGKYTLEQMAPPPNGQSGGVRKYLFHCRDELGRVAKVNDRFSGRVEQLLQQQLTRPSKSADDAPVTFAALGETPDSIVLGPTREQRAWIDDVATELQLSYPHTLRDLMLAEIKHTQLETRLDTLLAELGRINTWARSEKAARAQLEKSTEKVQKLVQKLTERTALNTDSAATQSEFSRCLEREALLRVYQPLRVCSDAWTLAQTQYRLARLDTVVHFLLEQHAHHRFLAAAYEMDYGRMRQRHASAVALNVLLNERLAEHKTRMTYMQQDLFADRSQPATVASDDWWFLSLNQLLRSVADASTAPQEEADADVDMMQVTDAVYTSYASMEQTAKELVDRRLQATHMAQQQHAECTAHLLSTRRVVCAIAETARQHTATRDWLPHATEILDRGNLVKRRVDELRPQLAETSKNQAVSNRLLRKRDTFCQHLLESDCTVQLQPSSQQL